MDIEAFFDRSNRGNDVENGDAASADAGALASTSGREKSELVRNDSVKMGCLLGKGHFGTVYKGKSNGKDIAVKKIDVKGSSEINVDEVLKEIDILKKLSHPNIVKYLGSELVKTKIHIYMEFCKEGDLGKIIMNRESVHFEELEITPWMRDIARGIEYLHDEQCIHRDIKPTNILLSGNTAKIADFGRSKIFDIMQNYYDASKGGDKRYMSPEFYEKGKFGRTGDMWSVGCTFYELTVLQPAFNEINEVLQESKRQLSLSRIPRGYSKGLRSLIKALLNPLPDERPTASEVIKKLSIENLSTDSESETTDSESESTDSDESLYIGCNESPFFYSNSGDSKFNL